MPTIKNVQVILENKQLEVPMGTTLKELLSHRDHSLPPAVAAVVNNVLHELSYPIYCPATINWLDCTHEWGNRIYKRSLSLLLYAISQKLYPNHKLRILHSLRNGYYCELNGQTEITAADIKTIEKAMGDLVKQNVPIEKIMLSHNDVQAFYRAWNLEGKASLMGMSSHTLMPIYRLNEYCEYFFSDMATHTGILCEFKLLPFDHGFVMMIPGGCRNKMITTEFKHPKKLQAALKSYDDWGTLMGIQNVNDLNQCIEKGKFNNLVLMAESMQQRNLFKITDSLYESFPEVKLVLIAGPSSSGKTTFTNRLGIELQALGLKPILISMDDYFLNRDQSPKDENGEYDFESIYAMDLDLFSRQINELLSGTEVEIPIYDFKTGTRKPQGNKVQLTDKHILLIEGIHGINPLLTEHIPAENRRSIYISCLTQLNFDDYTPIPSSGNRELRRLVRDIKCRGTSPDEVLLRWLSVRRGEEKNIFPYQENADYYFNSSLIYEISILKPLAEEALKTIGPSSAAYPEARRLLRSLRCFLPVESDFVPSQSLLQEFLGKSCFYRD
ncbi:MAG: nucleoside kinase [Clostridia bacterium]|jgi:uridine kinase|nr:nucleoside kinase [Clostridia bacterium]MDD4572168.1 nucleoside kinase [Clostridia bacterium]